MLSGPGGPAWCLDTLAFFYDYQKIYRYYNAKTIYFLKQLRLPMGVKIKYENWHSNPPGGLNGRQYKNEEIENSKKLPCDL